MHNIKLTWLGTAGFQVRTGDKTFLIDPYLSRNAQATPVQTLEPKDISGASEIFLTHGHFDHIYDIPSIVANGTATVYCSQIAAGTLTGKGVDKSRLCAVTENGSKLDLGGYQAQAFFSEHVRFDKALVARTLMRMAAQGPHPPVELSRDYPKGQVLSWRFTLNGFTMHHFGSAGSTSEELRQLALSPIDLLLVPLQGHSRICDIAVEYVKALKPDLVIPHHQDDFYPPISSTVNIEPFLKKVRQTCSGTEIRVMSFNETIDI